MKEKIILIGGGGHCKVVIDAILSNKEYDIVGIIDAKLAIETKILGIPVIGDDAMLADIIKKNVRNAFISIGSVGDCVLRKKVFCNAKKLGFVFPSIIHPKAVVTSDVKIGAGTFIAASATVNPGTIIGENVIINTSSSVDHDCNIGDYVHIAPGAILSGGVTVKAETHIGTGANVIQGITIGRSCLIKAGQLVKKDIEDEVII